MKHAARIGPLAVNKSFISKAKPFYFVFEEEVARYSKINKFKVSYAWCPCSVRGARRFYAEAGINDEKKFNLINNILFNKYKLKNYFKSGIIGRCSICSEPSSNSICQTCNIMSLIKSTEVKELVGVQVNKNERLCNS